MDQIPGQIYPQVAQQVIAVLNMEVSNLRAENAQLQNQLSRSSVRTEDDLHEPQNENTWRLLEEIQFLRSELQRRPEPEVSTQEKRFKRFKQRGHELEQNLRSQVEYLQAELGETKYAAQKEQAAKDALEKEVSKLRNDLNQRTQEGEEALACVGSQGSVDFDVRKFLCGELEELPPMPNPMVVTGQGEPQFKGVIIERRRTDILSVNGDYTIEWAKKGGGCVIPLPPIVYNGQRHAAEKPPNGPTEGCTYELFGVDGHCIYYGTYSCVKVVTMNWGTLSSLGHNFTDAFLETTVVQDSHMAPVIQPFMKSMYETGILNAACAVLRCEGFNNAIREEVRWRSVYGPPASIRNILIRNTGGKRPNTDGEASQGPSRRRKLRNDQPRRKIGTIGHKTRK